MVIKKDIVSAKAPVNKKLHLIQIFRGIAAMSVVIYHLGRSAEDYFHTKLLGDFFSFGYMGVDFFFVLSGFIITYVHFKDIVNSSNKITFLKKRFFRIYPIYWIIASVQLFLLVVVMHGKTAHLDHQMDFHKPSEWLYILGCYLLVKMPLKFFLTQAWTLSYELIFYIVFFIGICIGFKRAKYLALLWVVLIFAKIALSQVYQFPSLMILDERILQFLTGCVVAYLVLKKHFIQNYIWVLLFLAGISAYYFLAYPNDTWEIIVLGIVNGLVIYKIVVIDLFHDNKYPKFLLLLGEASYSIYLSHVIFLSLLLRIFGSVVNKFHITNYPVLQLLIFVTFAITVAFGFCVYKFVESPLLIYCQNRFIKGKSHPE